MPLQLQLEDGSNLELEDTGNLDMEYEWPGGAGGNNCGCCEDCFIFQDQFGRAENTNLFAEWEEVSGNWAIGTVGGNRRLIPPATGILRMKRSLALRKVGGGINVRPTLNFGGAAGTIRILTDMVDGNNYHGLEMSYTAATTGTYRLFKKTGGSISYISPSKALGGSWTTTWTPPVVFTNTPTNFFNAMYSEGFGAGPPDFAIPAAFNGNYCGLETAGVGAGAWFDNFAVLVRNNCWNLGGGTFCDGPCGGMFVTNALGCIHCEVDAETPDFATLTFQDFSGGIACSAGTGVCGPLNRSWLYQRDGTSPNAEGVHSCVYKPVGIPDLYIQPIGITPLNFFAAIQPYEAVVYNNGVDLRVSFWPWRFTMYGGTNFSVTYWGRFIFKDLSGNWKVWAQPDIGFHYVQSDGKHGLCWYDKIVPVSGSEGPSGSMCCSSTGTECIVERV